MSGFGKNYFPDGSKGIVNKHETQDVSGWAEYVGEVRETRWQGQGASYNNDNGQVEVGEYEDDRMKEGQTSTMNKDDTRGLYKKRTVDGKPEWTRV